LQMNETRILIRLLRMYIPRNWEFGSGLAKLGNFRGGGGFELPIPPFGTPLQINSYVLMSVETVLDPVTG
jgi:hypothetical protein